MTDNKFSAVVSDSTLAMYHSNIRTIAKQVGVGADWIKNADWLFAHRDKVFKMLEETPNIHTRKNRVSSLLWFAELHPTPAPIIFRLKSLQMDCFSQLQKGYETQEKTEKQEENWVTIEEIDIRLGVIKTLLELRAKDGRLWKPSEYTPIVQYLMLMFHRHLPLRNDLRLAKSISAEDYADFDEPPTDHNWLIKDGDDWRLVLNKYKTEGTYGQKIIQIPRLVSDALTTYLPLDKWFYEKRDGTPVSTSQYTNTFNDIFKEYNKKVGSTQIRRTIISALHQPKPHELKDKQDLAFIMGHSVGTAQGVYAKI